MFSSIVGHFDLPSNRLYAARQALERRGGAFTDLISGNVTAQSIQFPQTILRKALLQGQSRLNQYHPDPLGALQARQAISRYYASEGTTIEPEHIVLTPGTSQSYWYAFRLLMDVGDEVLFPKPSYPLLDSIAALCGVHVKHYSLTDRTGRWAIDLESVEAALSPRTKALVLVSPHNPTGAVATAEEVAQLVTLSQRNNLALIADEVFCPFLWNGLPYTRPANLEAPLVITLNGFSKMLALPGLKLGWMALSGQESRVHRAIKALEMISDTFLPVNEAVQGATSRLLKESQPFQVSYRKEMQKRVQASFEVLEGSSRFRISAPEGGFYATLSLADETEEEEVAVSLLEKERLLVHPGYFYDLDGSHLVVSLINKQSSLSAYRRLRNYLDKT